MRVIAPEFEHTDKRRTLTQIFSGPVAQVNNYRMSKGAVLGNHYHKETFETFYIIRGAVMVSVANRRFIASHGMVFQVEPGEMHTIEAISEGARMMTFLSKPYSKEDPDTWTE